jgi:cytochrome P450
MTWDCPARALHGRLTGTELSHAAFIHQIWVILAPMSRRGPRAASNAAEALRNNPLDTLERARQQYGDIVQLAERAVFSRTEDCAGTFAVFGSTNAESVLTDSETFVRPPSLAARLGLPAQLRNLSSGLFSMNAPHHRRHHALLAPLLTTGASRSYRDAIVAGCEAFLETWQPDQSVEMLNEMRRLSVEISSRLFFGSPPAGPTGIDGLVQRLLLLRRLHPIFSSQAAQDEIHVAMAETGARLDCALRTRVRELGQPGAVMACLVARMAQRRDGDRPALSEDELVAHAHALFLAACEPMAVTLTWALILLSQFPALRDELATHLDRGVSGAGSAELIDGVLLETLRLLPPSALLVRATRRETRLFGRSLPANAEVLLSPYVAHRDARVFDRPRAFDIARWQGSKPKQFEYFPFGAGERACLGRPLAMLAQRTALELILRRYSPTLIGDQAIGWHIAVVLAPATEVAMTTGRASSVRPGGRIGGPLRQLLELD